MGVYEQMVGISALIFVFSIWGAISRFKRKSNVLAWGFVLSAVTGLLILASLLFTGNMTLNVH